MSERTKALLKKALATHLAGRPEAALASYANILRLDPREFFALQLAGLASCQLGRLDDAVDYFRKALRIDPKSGATHIYLGLAYADFARDAEAQESFKAGLTLEPGNPEVWLKIGIFYLSRFRTAEAMNCCTQALRLKPDYGEALKSIGDIRQAEGDAVQAVGHYRAALKLDRENEGARIGLVQTLLSCNRVSESLAECETILAAQPRNSQAHSHRLFLLNYSSELSAEQLFAEHEKFGRLFAPAPRRRFANLKDPDKKIRVAFLSQDIRTHAVAQFLEPIVANLDPEKFEVVLYHDHMRVDAVSERFRSYAAIWRNFMARPDTLVEGLIRGDAPDIVVDVAGHSGQNRLQLFAGRLAPVQVTYLGYPNTTGLSEMDYRFTDEVADPLGDADRLNSEELVRFSPCAWAYSPPSAVETSVNIPPAGERDTVAFGSFNNLPKVNDGTLRLWGNVLAAVPGSRLVLKSIGMEPDRILPRLVQAGIDRGRVDLLSPVADLIAHMACYRLVDIALDPFPYGGTTTTCEALWMGRPVVTIAGDRHSSRVGASLLTAIGRPEWIARSPEEFVKTAAGLAADRQLLRTASAGLRGAVRRSPLLDHRGQARRFGEALRTCWVRWCEAEETSESRIPAEESRPELARA
jgi:predicted O-linked N-acetylglucosamine transferase (SPINDLY family)